MGQEGIELIVVGLRTPGRTVHLTATLRDSLAANGGAQSVVSEDALTHTQMQVLFWGDTASPRVINPGRCRTLSLFHRKSVDRRRRERLAGIQCGRRELRLVRRIRKMLGLEAESAAELVFLPTFADM